MADEVERIRGMPADSGCPEVLYASDNCTPEDIEEMKRAMEEMPSSPIICDMPDQAVLDLKERVKTLEERDLEDRRQMMDMQERVTAAEGYLSHMADRVGRCEERCDRMRSAMNLALLTVMASLGVDILVLLYHAGVIG